MLFPFSFLQAQGPTYDVDAAAFFARVTAAGGSLTLTEKSAVNTLVVQMKADGTWTLMKAIYPMVGASAAACAQNLKSSSFTGTFTSGWTFASTGVTPNGTSAYFDTTFNPITQSQAQNSTFLSVYSRTNSNIGTPYDIGSAQNYLGPTKQTVIITRYLNSQRYINIADNSVFISNAETDSRGFYCGGTNGSSTEILYKNGSNVLSGTSTQSGFANVNIYVGAINNNGTSVGFSNKENAFTSISNGLSPTQNSNFYTAVQAFQTTLSRQV